MSKILSYNKKTSGEDWIPLNNQYNSDEIEMIDDPNGGLSQQPRTAIPSPFAQMDLVKNAFRRLSISPRLQGESMDEKLVANALDIAQLFFNMSELNTQLHVVLWNCSTEIEQLKNSPEHQLLGETIEMFMFQDKEAFNFDKMDRLYFLVYGNQVIGSTSPVTLFMASPNAKEGMYDIPVEQNVKLFNLWRPLYMRNQQFVKYVYAMFTAYPQLKQLCGEVNAYLITNFTLLQPNLRDEILKEIGNPAAMDMANTGKALSFLESNFIFLDEGVQALGVPFYGVRSEDIRKAIYESDFLMMPSRKVEDVIPLVLQNHLNSTQSDSFKYITGAWDDNTIIKPEDYAVIPEKRILPATSHQYPWLTDDDFFEPALIKLDYTIDRDCFFDGNLTIGSRDTDNNHFVLPLKPLYFKYFNVSDLWGTINGRPRFEMKHTVTGNSASVTVTLRIPVQKERHFITLQRTYISAQHADLTYDPKNNHGYFITVPFALSIFPFVRTESLKQYNVQLVDRALGMLQNYRLDLTFFHDGYRNGIKDEELLVRERSLKSEKRVGSCYYRLQTDFDYITISLSDDHGHLAAQGILCPKWPDYIQGHESFTFAVDFGTTNTHIESQRTGSMPEPLTISSMARERLMATSYNGGSVLYDVIIKQEFLPKSIGNNYGFPQRTVLSECERMDAETVDQISSLGDANIPFIYEKESIGYGNRIVANLKWSTELANNKRIKAYLMELALLMRTKVLLENGDIAKTRLVWFYPLSMKVGNIRKLGEMWEKTFKEVFGIPATEDHLIKMPESVAPYYFYKSSNLFKGAASTVANIDIGGGSSDVVVYESNAKQPTLLTSFRFAANVLFGDGFSDVPHGDTNPMLLKYVRYFKRLFDADDDKYGELNGILDDIMAKRKSEDINTFLFSVCNNQVVGGNDVFSYNIRLNEDSEHKIIFIYFFATLIYYVARMMMHHHLDMPRSIMFSGTGSKVLDIVGNKRDLDLISQAIIERVYGRPYDSNGFSIVMEKNEPKQITCRGGLMQVSDRDGYDQVRELNELLDGFDNSIKYNYSMIEKETLLYQDMDNQEIRNAILEQVRLFNDLFCQLCDDIHVVDRFLVDNHSLQRFKDLMNKDLEHYLINGWNFVNKNQNDKNDNDAIEDTLFFYPIIGSIRNNLIDNL